MVVVVPSFKLLPQEPHAAKRGSPALLWVFGGQEEMTITHVSSEKKKQIKSIPVPEFGGIDHLPDDIDKLLHY